MPPHNALCCNALRVPVPFFPRQNTILAREPLIAERNRFHVSDEIRLAQALFCRCQAPRGLGARVVLDLVVVMFDIGAMFAFWRLITPQIRLLSPHWEALWSNMAWPPWSPCCCWRW